MIGQTISHFHILEKPPTTSGQVGEGGMSPARTTVRSGKTAHARFLSRFLDSAHLAGFWSRCTGSRLLRVIIVAGEAE